MAAAGSTEEGKKINDLLPEEILSRIFTTGCEELTFHFIPTSTRLVPAPSYEKESSPKYIRVMKPFSSLVACVCRTWRDLVRAKRNHHLWVTRVSLDNRGNYDEAMGYGDLAVRFAKFKFALEPSERSDLEVYWHAHGEPYETYRSHLKDPEIGLLAHGLRLVLPYAKQLRWFTAMITSDVMLGFVSQFLNCLGSAPRLEWIEIARLAGKKAPLRASSPEAFLDLLNLDTAFVPAERRELGFAEDEKLESLSHFQTYGIAPWESIQMPHRLISATLDETSSEDAPLEWGGFVNTIYRLQMVQRLDVSFNFVKGAVDPTYPDHRKSLPFLRTLSITADAYYGRAFLATFFTPNLVSLSIAADSGHKQLPPEALEKIILSKLRFLSLWGNPIHLFMLVSKIETPELETLRMTINESDSLEIPPDFRFKYPSFSAPKNIDIWSGMNHPKLLACLHLLDATNTERISFTRSFTPSTVFNNPFAASSPIVVAQEYVGPRLSLPKLREVACNGYSPNVISHILASMEAPLLSTLEMVSPSVRPHDRDILWSPPTLRSMNIFKQITHLRSELWSGELTRWNRVGHPLKYFYGLEELAITNSYRPAVLLWLRDGYVNHEALGVEEWSKMKLRRVMIHIPDFDVLEVGVLALWKGEADEVLAWRKKHDLPPVEIFFGR